MQKGKRYDQENKRQIMSNSLTTAKANIGHSDKLFGCVLVQ